MGRLHVSDMYKCGVSRQGARNENTDADSMHGGVGGEGVGGGSREAPQGTLPQYRPVSPRRPSGKRGLEGASRGREGKSNERISPEGMTFKQCPEGTLKKFPRMSPPRESASVSSNLQQPPSPPPPPPPAPPPPLEKDERDREVRRKFTTPVPGRHERPQGPRQKATAGEGSASDLRNYYARERKDMTKMFPEDVSWKTKIDMLRLAKEHAWQNGATRFSRHLYLWEKKVGLCAQPASYSLQTA